ncbi:S8 family serine peptidase [Mumia sp. ZJ430]|uniref:S8 family serine peptidase n=1 Tax=Mumia sp. ZJ430 TaxID=2708083 RepID=UPI00141D8442|nr:S8 family serine peptidase [Mumia sp. ZJ430]
MAPASSRRLGVTLAAALAITSVALTTPPTAAASGTPLIGADGADGNPIAVTLITGDRVLVSRAADGTPSAVVSSDDDFFTRRVGDDLYVIPAQAQRALAADRLDAELFNVTSLIDQGYDDAQSETLPLIVTGPLPQPRGASPLTVGADLESIDATAVSVDKENLATAYPQLVGGNARSASSADKVWLDAKVEGTAVALDPATGVTQTGAEHAWRGGYDGTGTKVAVLDTGYDPEHPDLAGQVVLAEDFTGEGATDHDGHGTHVASTIAGTGSADPSKVGMAPKTQLLIGKVLGWGGGQESWIIGGMEWAVAQGADVVNMSLGSTVPTDCTDPMSQAAQSLSEQSKTLFVIAAGNAGMRETVSSPGCAEGVLTVGAVDADGETASFSSRGSTVGEHRVKPDIAAPGVEIAGAGSNSPGGIAYTTMSGTSMASPHVAGAAALVRDAHPDWTAQQVRAALVGGVKKDHQGTVYEQGTGELWVPGALRSTLTSDVSVSLGTLAWPHTRGQEVTKQVTYTNDSDRPVRLRLDIDDLTGADARPVPESLLKLGAHTITVPAHGTKTVDVTARGHVGTLRDGAYGEIGGRILATGKVGHRAVEVTTAVGVWLEPETVTVTLKTIDRNGEPATSGALDITDVHQPARSLVYLDGTDLTLRLRAGSYAVNAFVETTDGDGVRSYSYVGDPEARLTNDTTVTLDARTAEPVTVSGDRPMTIRSGSLGFQRTWDSQWVIGNSVHMANNPVFYAAATDRVRNGDFTFGSYLRAYDPAVTEKDSAYVYNLAFTDEGRVSTDQSHVISDDDLASVTEHWYGQRRAQWAPEEWTRVVPGDGTGPFFASSGDAVAAPGDRTAYYTPGVAWQQLASGSGWRTMPETWFDLVRTYEAGSRGETEWFKLPHMMAMNVNADGTPSRVAERQGSLVGFAFPVWQDSTDGRIGVQGFADLGRMQVSKNGELLDESAVPSGQFAIGDETSELSVKVWQARLRRDQVWEIGRGTITTYTFDTARPDGDAVAALPVSVPGYDAPVDTLNTAPAETDFPVSVTLQGQDGYDPGTIGSFTAKVTFDEVTYVDALGMDRPLESLSWTEVPVVQRDGRWVALVDNTGEGGKTASLWIQAEDENGSRTEQVTFSLYAVR